MSLESLRSQLSSCRSRLQSEKATLKIYKAKAKELDKLYEEMKDKKRAMKGMKEDMSTFAGERYTYFNGNVFNTRYESKLRDHLINDKYSKIITIIDDNLDDINTERTRYENLVFESHGIIGRLESSINSLITSIENWMN